MDFRPINVQQLSLVLVLLIIPSSSQLLLGGWQDLEKAVNCNFTNDMCYWSQSINDDFDWTFHAGSTSSTNTGPSADHTTGTRTGKYMYIESSSPRRHGDSAILTSHVIRPRNHQYMCFSLWYHMYGSNIGGLSVSIKRELETAPVTEQLWETSGNHGNVWLKAETTIKPPGPLKIIIKGTVGLGYEGDIAIDDLSLTANKCPYEKYMGCFVVCVGAKSTRRF